MDDHGLVENCKDNGNSYHGDDLQPKMTYNVKMERKSKPKGSMYTQKKYCLSVETLITYSAFSIFTWEDAVQLLAWNLITRRECL